MRDADKLPYLNRRFRLFLNRLGRLQEQVATRTGDAAVPTARLMGDAVTVRAAAAELLEAQRAASLGDGLGEADPDLAVALWLMARCGDAAFTDVRGWGDDAAPLLSDDFPVPGGLAPDPLDHADRIVESRAPDPHRAELYLIALGGGAAHREEAAHRLPDLARAALGGTGDDRLPRPGEPLFPEAYPSQRRRGTPRRVPAISGAVTGALVTAGVLLLLSVVIWFWATGDLQHLLRTILRPAATGQAALAGVMLAARSVALPAATPFAAFPSRTRDG